jgi:hypothetical protein
MAQAKKKPSRRMTKAAMRRSLDRTGKRLATAATARDGDIA